MDLLAASWGHGSGPAGSVDRSVHGNLLGPSEDSRERTTRGAAAMSDRVATAEDRRQAIAGRALNRPRPRRAGDSAIVGLADVVAVASATVLVPSARAFVAVVVAAGLVIGWVRADHVQPRLSISPSREAVRAAWFAGPALVLACGAAAVGTRQPGWLAFGLTLLGLCVGARALAFMLINTARRRRRLLRPTVVACGSDLEVAERVTNMVRSHPECGLDVVGHVGDCLHGDVARIDPRTVLDLAARDVCVVVATHQPIDPRLAKLVEEAPGVETFLTLRPLEATLCSQWTRDHIWAQPVGWVPARSKRLPTVVCKRLVDVTGALVLLVLCSPLLTAVAIGVRASSPGPIMFRQRRVGWDGRPFQLLKFRTMHTHADSDSLWSPAGDDRITPIGRFLRRTGLDELPQLFNILRGDMSLVGPRPERPHFARQFAEEVPSYARRYRLPGGLTGLAQVEDLRGDTSIADRTRFDNRYIDNWSVAADLTILVRTVRTVFRRGSH
jgi:exopolysaccharide biosynthesis polyprenyl glycosylphosphotransferase